MPFTLQWNWWIACTMIDSDHSYARQMIYPAIVDGPLSSSNSFTSIANAIREIIQEHQVMHSESITSIRSVNRSFIFPFAFKQGSKNTSRISLSYYIQCCPIFNHYVVLLIDVKYPSITIKTSKWRYTTLLMNGTCGELWHCSSL